MRIVVIGAGGIGGWLGARLAATGQQIGFLVHGGTLEALRSGGLTLLDLLPLPDLGAVAVIRFIIHS